MRIRGRWNSWIPSKLRNPSSMRPSSPNYWYRPYLVSDKNRKAYVFEHGLKSGNWHKVALWFDEFEEIFLKGLIIERDFKEFHLSKENDKKVKGLEFSESRIGIGPDKALLFIFMVFMNGFLRTLFRLSVHLGYWVKHAKVAWLSLRWVVKKICHELIFLLYVNSQMIYLVYHLIMKWNFRLILFY